MTKEQLEKEAYQYDVEHLRGARGAEGQLTEAKSLIERLIDTLECADGEQTKELKVVKEALQFLKE